MDAVSARRVVARALEDTEVAATLTSRPLHVVAVGKAAAPMAAAFAGVPHLAIRTMVAIGTHATPALPSSVEWIASSHPFPDARSEAAARRAVAVAHGVHSGEALVLLLSGGASALMAAPIEGVTLADKVATTRTMMHAGADILALNTVRRHLSMVKGGRLAAASVGATITLAISDVVGDDLSAIGSGPGVGDPSTWADVARFLDRFGGDRHAVSVRRAVERGLNGELPDTPNPGAAALSRAVGRVLGSRRDAMEGARAAAASQGYHPIVLPEPVTGEARDAAPAWLDRALAAAGASPRPVCVISSGETTVRVTGSGQGGRNLEFALALVGRLASSGATLASAGTDGVDGTSGVAGAIAGPETVARAGAAGLDSPDRYLAANDSLAFFAPLDDVIRLGRTDTNVGDLQVLLID